MFERIIRFAIDQRWLVLLAVLGMELQFAEMGVSGSLDELRRERGGGV